MVNNNNFFSEILWPLGKMVLGAGAAYTALSLGWSVLYLIGKDFDTTGLKSRNQQAFNSAAQVQNLDIPVRSWNERQEEVVEEIRNESRFFHWFFLDGFANDGDRAIEAADAAHIYFYPAPPGGQAALTVNEDFGCLAVPFEESDGLLSEKAGALLREFDNRANNRYNPYGKYYFTGTEDGAEIRFVPQEEGAQAQAAADCPALPNMDYQNQMENWRKSEPPVYLPR